MEIICFPFERVIEINAYILSTEKGMKGQADILYYQYLSSNTINKDSQ